MADERTVDWGASGRVDEYTAVAVDPFTLEEYEELYLKEGESSITYAYESDNHMEATIELAEGNYLESGLASMQRMVRIYDTVTIGSFSKRYSLGTFFVSNVTNNSLHGREKRSLTCYGPMYRFTEDYLCEDFIRSAGTNCIDNMQYIIERRGGTMVLGDGVDATQTHTKDIAIAMGYNLADALNTYAGWLGDEIVSNMDGTLLLRQYVSPLSRDPVYEFEEGGNCIYLPGVEFEVNRDEPINRVIAYFSREQKDDDDEYPLSDSCHVELDESAAFSYENCGRYRTEVMEVSEPCSHEDLVSQATRVLEENSSQIMYMNIEHAGVPWLHVGDCVKYVNNRDPGRSNVSYAVIEEMSVQSLSPLCMTKTKLRCYY